ncbi:NAD(P)-dependent oxidoreductase [Pseudothauera nasutitermitis]|uniref:NAD(P)-dependent oxidoreductase n=1 Tax=Pseudothauera nasutitermitis TaxID=2565930 RepID=A0A4S4AZL1_9RHOO|nr:NAD(P)-dependent oxidoreductase [Pseudothauera nasutitermitis]THF64062.1 NAD(P)-dependent oxidoreductase [Pseudothauera nasutitermitis]
MKVGFVGLGTMGAPMAGRLLDAGHDLALWARRPESTAALAARGAHVCPTPAALAGRCEVVISIVTSSADVEQLAFGPGGLAEGFAPGSVHVDMSTIAPGMARALAARYAALGVGWLDAPVSGGEQAAREATLAIMAGGEAAVLEQVRPLLSMLGRRIVHVGEAGAGQVAKACNQMVMVNAIQACAEAMHLARAHGVDLAAVQRALMGGSAASRVLEMMGGRMIARDYANGIESRLHHKDFGLLLAEAGRLGVALPVAACTAQQLNALMARGGGRDDTSGLLGVLEAAGPSVAD